MIEFCVLPNDNAVMAHSPLLRAAQLTLQYAQIMVQSHSRPAKHSSGCLCIGLQNILIGPIMGYDDLFSVNKVLNEYDFPPLSWFISC